MDGGVLRLDGGFPIAGGQGQCHGQDQDQRDQSCFHMYLLNIMVVCSELLVFGAGDVLSDGEGIYEKGEHKANGHSRHGRQYEIRSSSHIAI